MTAEVELARAKLLAEAEVRELEREQGLDRASPGLIMAGAGYRAHEQHAATRDEGEESRMDSARYPGPLHPGHAEFMGATWPEPGQAPPRPAEPAAAEAGPAGWDREELARIWSKDWRPRPPDPVPASSPGYTGGYHQPVTAWSAKHHASGAPSPADGSAPVVHVPQPAGHAAAGHEGLAAGVSN